MVSLKAKVNTFFQDNHELFIDPLSKCFLVAEFLLGLNRLPVLITGRKYFYFLTTLSCVYSLFINFGALYATNQHFVTIVLYILWSEFVFCDVVSFVTWKRIYRYYSEINKFDTEIGCRPKTTSESLRHSIFMAVLLTFIVTFHLVLAVTYWDVPLNISIPFIVFDVAHYLEVSYCGHILSLLEPRLCLINYYMVLSVSSESFEKSPDIEEFVSFKNKNNRNGDMNKLMDLYQILIKTYDLLMDAIKWQLLMILISSFLVTLCICHSFAYSIMHVEGLTLNTTTSIGIIVTQMAPLFSPCIFGDRVHNQVRKLRELIASRLYENKLDKAGRSSARALLALTEARDLSFSLLRMLRVDVALPFKFIGLLVTYLIILLQFDKVIHPATSITTNVTTT